MSGALDMALDDVISQTRSSSKRNINNNTRRGSTRGGGINKNRSSGGRSSPYNNASRPVRSNNNTSFRNTRSADNRQANTNRNNNSLVVANLHFNVTEKDLYDLFGQIGQLKRAFLHIGPNGKSAGIADVVFVNGHDAEKARNTYNNVELDGRPMRITQASIITAVTSAPSNTGNRRGNLRGGINPRDNNSRRDNRDNRDNRGRGNGRRDTRPKPSQQDLDAEMDTYMGSTNNEDVSMN